jgi:cell division protein FtsN
MPPATRVPAVAPEAAPEAEEGPASLLPPPAPAPVALEGAPEVTPTAYAPAPSSGGFMVQVGAYADLSNAHRVRDAVAGAGPVQVDVRETTRPPAASCSVCASARG